MGVVAVNLAMSLDGYITGPDPDAAHPMGTYGGEVIAPGGEVWMAEQTLAEAGAVVAGRRVYDLVDGWGDQPPFRMPAFVPTHRHQPPRTAGATTFTFVDDVATAVSEATRAANGKNVYVMGGANVADQALRLGLVDELHLHIFPILVGAGTRLFDGLDPTPINLERIQLLEGPRATHVTYRVLPARAPSTDA